jgi:hypothetical protein
MTTPTTQQAEALWVTAHEHVRRGDFASATRDLAQCFAILQANNDPRLPEVHRRWTEVHQLAVEEAAQGRPITAQPAQTAPSLEAEAEAAANAGNLEEAIALYERALAQRPDNELVAERLLELKNARLRAAALTSTALVGAFDEEALAASIDLADDLVDDDNGVGGGTVADGEPAAPERAADDVERADALEDTLDFVPGGALALPIREDDFGDVVPAIVRAEAAERAAPRPAIVRDEAVERSIAVEPIADDDDATAVVTPAIVRDEAVERRIAVEPIADDSQTNIHDAVTLVPQRHQPGLDDAPAKTTAKMYLEDLGAPAKITASMYLDDVNAAAAVSAPLDGLTGDVVASRLLAAADALSTHDAHPAQARVDAIADADRLAGDLGDDADWGGTPSPAAEAITGDDPRWGTPSPAAEAISGDDPRWGTPSPAAEAIGGDDPRWGVPSPAAEAISGDDPRWGAPSPAAEAISGDDPRWGAPSPAAEAISGDDPRWGGPPATTAPLMAMADAPVGMPSLDIDIDIGAMELPIDADDLMMVGDDDIMAQSLPPQPALKVAEVLADGFPADPEAMLNAVLDRVRSNRRAA